MLIQVWLTSLATACPGLDPSRLIGDAERSAFNGYANAAVAALDAAVIDLGCRPPVSAQDLARFARTMAVIEDEGGRDAVPWLVLAATLEPHGWTDEFSRDLLTRKLPKDDVALMPLEVHGAVGADEIVFIDGQRETAPYRVPVSAHLVQVGVGPERIRFAGIVVSGTSIHVPPVPVPVVAPGPDPTPLRLAQEKPRPRPPLGRIGVGVLAGSAVFLVGGLGSAQQFYSTSDARAAAPWKTTSQATIGTAAVLAVGGTTMLTIGLVNHAW